MSNGILDNLYILRRKIKGRVYLLWMRDFGCRRPRTQTETQRSGVQRMKRFLGVLLAASGLFVASAHAQLPQIVPPSGTFTDQYGTWTFGSKLADGDYQICLSGTSTNGAGVILQTSTLNAWTTKGYWQAWGGAAFSSGAGTAGQSCSAAAPPPPTPPASTSFGIQPIATPYPLQPGFTPITAISQITGPGRYQLTRNDADAAGWFSIIWDNVMLDGGGFGVTTSTGQPITFEIQSSNVLVRNFIASPINVQVYAVEPSQNGITIQNNLIAPANNAPYSAYINADANPLTNVSFVFNTLENASDSIVVAAGPNIVGGLVFANNLFSNGVDAGIEFVGTLSGASIIGNHFAHLGIAIGGWYAAENHNCCFEMFNTSIMGNVVDSSTVTYLYDFPIHGYSDGDQDATLAWGYGGTAWPAGVLDNIFIGNVFETEPLP